MKRSFALIAAPAATALVIACAPSDHVTAAQEALGAPTELADKVAYSIGANLGRSLKQQGVDFDVDYIARGIQDALGDGELLLSQEEMATAVQEFQQQLADQAGAENRAEAEEFLASNGARDGVTTLPSGLQYEVVQAGEGPKPSASDRVTVHYRGSLVDGTQFDSSYDRGQPATFRLDQVIPGWSEGLQLMSVGSIYKLYIPGVLGYGSTPPPGPIGPDATLVFEVELLAIE
jgi:FKBP-type peptidyl-prolyl cis-trans isomerase